MTPVKHQYTEEQIAEVFKAAGSFTGFLEVIGQDSEQQPWWSEVSSVLINDKTVLTAAPPETDIDLFTALYCLWSAIFKSCHRTLILLSSQDRCREVGRRVADLHGSLVESKPWLIPALTVHGTHRLGFDNDSDILLYIASENAGRGLSTDLMVFHDVLEWKSRVYDEVIMALFPTIASRGRLLIVGRSRADHKMLPHSFHSHWLVRGQHVPGWTTVGSIAGSAEHTAD